MHKYLSSSLNSVVSIDLESSWAAKSLQEALHQTRFDARFQQKQIQEREEKLLRLYENQQQKAFERVSRGSAGSNTSVGSTGGGGKVRQMFDERRQKAGIDKSYPLEPLKSKSGGRGASVDRLKNSSSRTVIKSTVQKSVGQMRNGKPVVKREVVQSIYNNNNGVESYEERKFEDDNMNERFNRSQRDLVEMMNNHNLHDSLDNEEMPRIGFDEPDEPFFTGKLANVGGRLPSESVTKTRKPAGTTLGKTFRKDTKPIVKRTVRTVTSPQALNSSPSVQSQPSKTVSNSPLSSPIKTSVSQTMFNFKASSKKAAAPQPANSARAPCNTRPSSKQTGKTAVARDDLNECRYCNRRFAADRIGTHEEICGKTARKKRKAYDATKHRVEGTELEQYVRKGKSQSTSKANANKQSSNKKDWRRTHEEFINAIRAAKQAQAHIAKGGKLSDLPPPPPSSNPDYVQCPHCSRKFNESAAERHIPKCATYQFNKPKQAPPKGKAASGRK